MIQEVFRIGSFAVSPFGILLVVALFAAYWQLTRGMKFYNIGDQEDSSAVVFACGFIGILGGKIYYAILMGDWRLILDRAGIVWYGCFFGGLLALLWTIRRRGLPFARTFDATGPALALGYGVGRIGCFLVGDDYGIPSDLPWAMEFRNGLPPTRAGILRREFGVEVEASIPDEAFVAVHPTQLYETLAGLLIWVFVLRLMRRRTRPGSIFLAALALLVLERFLVEFIRAKDDRFFGTFTLAQVLSVAILTAIALVAWRLRSAGPPVDPKPTVA